ncbi:hypothetical protein GLE_0022 [Lysobacter enzymogenes]|uniref:Uncharacterized protein n=1 Tax=Lysobacter enzymogenes TaxID=69 RepID=A0A0S2DA52_LYSEN|nr:hypothetical protein GLE_0022 [Lysobacter enzymogenes]
MRIGDECGGGAVARRRASQRCEWCNNPLLFIGSPRMTTSGGA